MSSGLVLLVASLAVVIVIGAAARAAWRERRTAPSRVAYPTDRIEDPLVAAINRTHGAREPGGSSRTAGPNADRASNERRAVATVGSHSARAGEPPRNVNEPGGPVPMPVRTPTWVTQLEPHPTVISTWRVDPAEWRVDAPPRKPVGRDDKGGRRSA